MDTAHINRLKEHFGFMPINPTENFYEYPCAGTLSNIPKAIQTEEMVLLALENEEPYATPVLKYTAKRLKTDEMCDKAVAANVLNFIYTPEEYRTDWKWNCSHAVGHRLCRSHHGSIVRTEL